MRGAPAASKSRANCSVTRSTGTTEAAAAATKMRQRSRRVPVRVCAIIVSKDSRDLGVGKEGRGGRVNKAYVE